jgi:paraquat-inducible protein A
MTRARLIACHECDLLQYERPLLRGATARCVRCNAELYRDHPDSIARALAYTLAAMILFAVANAYPIVGLSVHGDLVETSLFGAADALYRDGMWPIAGLVFVTAIVMPLLQMLAMLYLLLPLWLGRVPLAHSTAFHLLYFARPWAMIEVLILGMLVALVKLAVIASVVPGVSLWAFGAVMVLLAAAAAAFDPRECWARIRPVTERDNPPIPASAATAAGAGLFACHECGVLSTAGRHLHDLHCSRCGAALHFRKVASISRTWAFIISAVVLYIPANALPVMNTSSLFGSEKDTILSGVVYLWTSGSWPLAIIVFIASIAVPMLKILALVFLVVSVQLRAKWLRKQRTAIYRLVELVGRWSMLDIYVITVLVALVQFSALATIQAGPGAIAFGAVVVLTMFAAMSFDPRLIWDVAEADHG